jgi:RimJ/RimL family protein N-acetyltransferase
MDKLSLDQFGALAPLFDLPQLQFVVTAMAAGNSPAVVYADDPVTPQTAFIWDQAHCFYLSGDHDNDRAVEQLRGLIQEVILPTARGCKIDILKLYTVQPAWEQHVNELFAPFVFQSCERVLFKKDNRSPDDRILSLPPELSLREINRDLLIRDPYRNTQAVLEEIESCWTSLERFLEQGFGIAAIHDWQEIVGWCTAEYVSRQECGIGIETVEPYMNRSIATWATRAFLQLEAAQGRTIHWDSWSANIPSVRVAQKAGFQKIVDYSIWLGLLS